MSHQTEIEAIVATMKMFFEPLRPAMLAIVKENFDEAQRIFETLLEKYPESSFVVHDYAVFLSVKGSMSEARSMFIKATHMEPKRPTHFLDAAICLQDMGRNAAALSLLQSAIVHPDFTTDLSDEKQQFVHRMLASGDA